MPHLLGTKEYNPVTEKVGCMIACPPGGIGVQPNIGAAKLIPFYRHDPCSELFLVSHINLITSPCFARRQGLWSFAYIHRIPPPLNSFRDTFHKSKGCGHTKPSSRVGGKHYASGTGCWGVRIRFGSVLCRNPIADFFLFDRNEKGPAHPVLRMDAARRAVPHPFPGTLLLGAGGSRSDSRWRNRVGIRAVGRVTPAAPTAVVRRAPAAIGGIAAPPGATAAPGAPECLGGHGRQRGCTGDRNARGMSQIFFIFSSLRRNTLRDLNPKLIIGRSYSVVGNSPAEGRQPVVGMRPADIGGML